MLPFSFFAGDSDTAGLLEGVDHGEEDALQRHWQVRWGGTGGEKNGQERGMGRRGDGGERGMGRQAEWNRELG